MSTKDAIVTVAGWGKTGASKDQSNTLLAADLITYSNPQCELIYKGLEANHLCAYEMGGWWMDG